MVRYRYNAQLDPAAPFVHVALQHPETDEAIADLPAQLDTAADITVVPQKIIDSLGLVPVEEIPVMGFGGYAVERPCYFVKIALRDLPTVGVKILGEPEEPFILLGRDVLNHFHIVLDGKQGVLEVTTGD